MLILIAVGIGTRVLTTLADSDQGYVDKGLLYLRSQQLSDGQIQGFAGVSGWATMAFAAAGIDSNSVALDGGQSLVNYLKAYPPTTTASATEWERGVLAITATSENPFNFGGIDYVGNLKSHYNNGQLGSLSLLNDDIFGLLSLTAANESTTSAVVRDSLSFLISHQNADGGFGYSTAPGSDVDDSAAALMALAATQKSGVGSPELSQAVNVVKDYILSTQNSDGGFPYDPNPATSWDTSSNVSTTAWVVMALSASDLGNTTSSFNAVSYLKNVQQADGSFPYQPTFPPGDTFDTAYATLALTGKFLPVRIYTATSPTSSATLTSTPTPTPTPTSTPTPPPSPTNTPTPTPSPTPPSTPTPAPTPTPTGTPTPTLTSTPTPLRQGRFQNPSAPTTGSPYEGAVLGTTIGTADQKEKDSEKTPRRKLLAQISLIAGLYSLTLYAIRFYRGK